ncbi:MAG TPA: class I SAM-dependent methyltransferase [Saprospiraceae bacterium]|nr:class I SAM-dependent methyltransferase [Saprospiraceae bacterium]
MNNIKSKLAGLLNRFPYIKTLYKFRSDYYKNSCYEPGHYYSPIVNMDDIKRNEIQIWKNKSVEVIPGINLDSEEQLLLLNEFGKYYQGIPFSAIKQKNRRYYFENDLFSYTDGIMLYSFIRHFKPRRLIEAGSGFTSALFLDVNSIYFEKSIKLSFIEPYPERLYSLISEEDKKNTEIIVDGIQSVDESYFEQLKENDILFIDGSHISKTGSDVNFVLFEILPKLHSGVLIHFHDIFYPFEYPKEWVYGGFNWNEIYLIHAFLMNNAEYKIKLFAHYLHTHHPEAFREMPLCYKNSGGSLWLQKK